MYGLSELSVINKVGKSWPFQLRQVMPYFFILAKCKKNKVGKSPPSEDNGQKIKLANNTPKLYPLGAHQPGAPRKRVLKRIV